MAGEKQNADVIVDILEGAFKSRTGIPYRGKGLPAMMSALDRGQIRGLIVAANDAMARVVCPQKVGHGGVRVERLKQPQADHEEETQC